MALNPTTDRLKAAKNLKAERKRMKAILDRLSAEFKPWPKDPENKFLLLVRIVLSQNTNDKNSSAAYDRLVSKFRTPKQIADADYGEIQELIRVGGLYKEKSKRLKEISRIVLEKYGGNISSILKKPTEEARKELISFPGVGLKTADVLLAFGANRDVFPVDTHVFRLSKRLGFAKKKDDYEKTKTKLEVVTPAGRRIAGHIMLIQLGRRYCHARNPEHLECPVNRFCPIGIRRAGLSRPSPRRARRL